MRKLIFTCLAIPILTACSDNVATTEASSADQKLPEVKGSTLAEMTKDGPNVTTRQADDAWLVHRITSIEDQVVLAYSECVVESEFENKGDVGLYMAQVKYKTKLVKEDPDNYITNQEVVAQVAPPWGEPNLDPLMPGESRPAKMARLHVPCDSFIELALSGFVARAVNPDGTQKYRAVVDGAPAVIIDNQTDFKITRD